MYKDGIIETIVIIISIAGKAHGVTHSCATRGAMKQGAPPAARGLLRAETIFDYCTREGGTFTILPWLEV